MKKILTLLVMFLATASILMAQTPQLNYQMIVRNQKATDVTIGEKVFHANDLVYSTPVTGDVQVLTGNTANSSAAYSYHFENVVTNMNGMLTIHLINLPNQTPLEKIDWTQSWFRVSIPACNIDTIMEILPVTYAYKTLANRDITTPRIVKYINGSGEEDVKRIDTAITQNEVFINALRDSVANAMKRHPGKVKELAIYFIETVVPQDFKDAAKAVNKDVAEFVKDTVADYIKNHREEAYNIVKYFIGQTTVEDVTGLWSAAIHGTQADAIVEMLVDSVNDYIGRHPELAKKTAFYVVKRLTSDQVFALQNYAKTINPGAYNAAKDIFDSIIDVCMNNSNYQKIQCDVANLCDLKAEIDQFRDYGSKHCPVISSTEFTATNNNLTTAITNNTDNVAINQCWYEVSFPNSNYPTETITASLNSNGTQMSAVFNSDWLSRKCIVTPKMKAACMDVETSGTAITINCQDNNCACPNIASFTHTSDAAGNLINYHGIVLTAELTNNYYNNQPTTCGFEYKEGNGEWKELHNTNSPAVLSTDQLTVTDTLKMDFCGKTLLVRPYVKCGNTKYYGQYSDGETVTLRQFNLFISPVSPVTGATEFTVTNGIYIGSNEFGTHWPSVEQIVAKYGTGYGVNVNPQYEWKNGDTVISQTKNATIGTSGEYKVKCTIPALFNSSASCVLEKKFDITVQ